MSARRREVFWLAVTLGIAAGLLIGAGEAARAQHTPDPYNIVGEYNNQYEPYMYATYPSAVGTLPNQARLEGRTGVRAANSFQSFMEAEGDEPGDLNRSSAPRMSGPGVPYYRAYRHLDDKLNRTYRPNAEVDDAFFNSQQQRDKKYFQALREQDPRKRTQMLREYSMDQMRSNREPTGNRSTSERDAHLPRDRFSTGGRSGFNTDDQDDAEMTRPRSSAPLPRRSSGDVAPPPPSSRASSGSSVLSGIGSPRSSRLSAPPAPSRSSFGSSSSTTDVLKRSELMDRARRSTLPALPGSLSPPPPPR